MNHPLLDRVSSPADLKSMSTTELQALSEEIRQVLLTRITATGGHMGSNLGFVEATVALHYVFHSPVDKFVFDVSHQSYTHKILTGRKAGYTDPEQYHSLSGYTTPSESEHDFFKVGHTSTSVSLAAGLAKGRDLTGGSENIVAVIGDGSLSGGEAYEGLNNAAVLGSNIIIVVNDNEMSIAPNQGGLYENLRQLRETKGAASNNFFKALGFDYLYVEDGNDVSALVEAFARVKDTAHPTVVHIHTDKGRGCDWAEADKESGHWALPAGVDKAAMAKTPTYNQLTADYLRQKMQEDPSVIVLSAGTPGATGLTPAFRREVGRQFLDVGIAEETAVAMSSGIARNGGKPVYEVLSSFLQRTYDQLNQDLAMNSNPATILVFGGSIGGGDCTHNGMYDIALTSSIPNLIGVAPATQEEYFALLDWSMSQRENPVVIRVPGAVLHGEAVPTLTAETALRGKVLHQGQEVAILGLGSALPLAQQAAELLQADGIDATVVNPICYSHPDKALLDELAKSHRLVVTVENGVLDGGFGQKVAACYGSTDIHVLNFGGEKAFNDLVPAAVIAEKNHMTPALMAQDIKAAL